MKHFQLMLPVFGIVFFAVIAADLQDNADDNKAELVQVKNSQQKNAKVKTVNKLPSKLIAGSKECGDDVIRICGSKKYRPNNNFDMLICLTNNQDTGGISRECNQFLWHFKANLTESEEFGRMALKHCNGALTHFTECSTFEKMDGKVISCLNEKRDSIKEEACLAFLTKFQTLIFSDFHLICDFITECKHDILRHHCGSLERGPDEGVFQHSQGEVVACLEDKLVDDTAALQPSCFHQVIRIAELAADDYHLDRALYFKCRNDRENLCSDVVAGQGKVYQCLFNHKFDPQMSVQCREALTARQKVQAIDYKANSALLHECRADIVKRNCNASAGPDHLVHLSSVLLCLERSEAPLSPRCDDELVEFRKMLMEDYELSPEITLHCKEEINRNCGRGVDKQGKTIHCLMKLARSDTAISKKCTKALSELIEETGTMEDYRMDPVLTSACRLTISTKCTPHDGDDAMVLSCLMDHLHDHDTKRKCKEALLELQYFVSRDFRLDPSFNDACHDDVMRKCKVPAGSISEQNRDPIQFSFVLACLYSRMRSGKDEDRPISEQCKEEVRRVIRQRALDFHLNPDLEEKCRGELARHCSTGNHEKNTEFECLQDHYEELKDPACREEIGKLTSMESENILDFDAILARECDPMLKQYCQSEMEKSDEGEVIECLIKNKHRMESSKCAAGVTHFQLIELKNYNFTYKFTKMCRADVKKHCSNKTTKPEVVECLSLLVRNRALEDDKHTVAEVSQGCREQLTVEKLQMHTDIILNPELHENCRQDVKKFCGKVKSGNAKVVECLRKHKKKLQPVCYQHLFEFEKEESENPRLDVQLMRKCKSDIQKHCHGYEMNQDTRRVIECLIENKDQLLDICRGVVLEREEEMFSDIALNIDLLTNCAPDIEKYCSDVMKKADKERKKGKDPSGIVYDCLTKVFIENSKSKVLSEACYSHVEFVVKEEDRNYALNAQLVLHCAEFIDKECSPETGENVMKCLEKKFLDDLIKDQSCMLEVAKMLRAGHSDIMADPLLHDACSLDIPRLCHNVNPGHGRVISCLLDSSGLGVDCKQMLEERQKMWNVVRKTFNGLSDIRNSIIESEHATYLMSMLTFLLILILCTGAFCGRMSKRVSADRKTR